MSTEPDDPRIALAVDPARDEWPWVVLGTTTAGGLVMVAPVGTPPPERVGSTTERRTLVVDVDDDRDPAEDCLALGHRQEERVGAKDGLTWWRCRHCDQEWETEA